MPIAILKNKKKIIITILAALVVILTWAPWLSRESIRDKTYEERAEADGTKDAGCNYDQWMIMPFGRYINSCEAGYVITFWGQRL